MAKPGMTDDVTVLDNANMQPIVDAIWDAIGDGTNAPTTAQEALDNLFTGTNANFTGTFTFRGITTFTDTATLNQTADAAEALRISANSATAYGALLRLRGYYSGSLVDTMLVSPYNVVFLHDSMRFQTSSGAKYYPGPTQHLFTQGDTAPGAVITCYGNGATFTGSISGSVLTVTELNGGTIRNGMYLRDATGNARVPSGVSISSLGTGTGGIGTYNLSSAPGDLASQDFMVLEGTGGAGGFSVYIDGAGNDKSMLFTVDPGSNIYMRPGGVLYSQPPSTFSTDLHKHAAIGFDPASNGYGAFAAGGDDAAVSFQVRGWSSTQTADLFQVFKSGAGSELFAVTVNGPKVPTGARLDLIDNQSTVGAAGSASALPATPTGYANIQINGTEYVVPYYAAA